MLLLSGNGNVLDVQQVWREKGSFPLRGPPGPTFVIPYSQVLKKHTRFESGVKLLENASSTLRKQSTFCCLKVMWFNRRKRQLDRYHHFHFADGKTEAHRYLSHLPQVSELESRRASFWRAKKSGLESFYFKSPHGTHFVYELEFTFLHIKSKHHYRLYYTMSFLEM